MIGMNKQIPISMMVNERNMRFSLAMQAVKIAFEKKSRQLLIQLNYQMPAFTR